MKVADWIRYNQDVLNIDDVVVKVFRQKSVKRDDVAIDTVMNFHDMAQIFGEYTIHFINFAEHELSISGTKRTTLRFGIYYNEEATK